MAGLSEEGIAPPARSSSPWTASRNSRSAFLEGAWPSTSSFPSSEAPAWRRGRSGRVPGSGVEHAPSAMAAEALLPSQQRPPGVTTGLRRPHHGSSAVLGGGARPGRLPPSRSSANLLDKYPMIGWTWRSSEPPVRAASCPAGTVTRVRNLGISSAGAVLARGCERMLAA